MKRYDVVHRRPPPHSAEAELIRENVRKLGLWNSLLFRPIATHDDLLPIMTTLGFFGRPGGSWREYLHPGAREGTPRPRLPFPRIDGLHMATYAAFLDAVNFYLGMDNVADIFHVREMKLHNIYDRNERWIRMEDDEYSVFLYRFGTLEPPVQSFSLRNFQNGILDAYSKDDSMFIHKHVTSTPTIVLVPLNDIIVRPPTDSELPQSKSEH